MSYYNSFFLQVHCMCVLEVFKAFLFLCSNALGNSSSLVSLKFGGTQTRKIVIHVFTFFRGYFDKQHKANSTLLCGRDAYVLNFDFNFEEIKQKVILYKF